MKPTAFIYSSHDRSEYMHREYIVQPALESWDNKTLLHLPWSQRDRRGQEWDYNGFRWFYDRFAQYGLSYRPFFWVDDLSEHDLGVLLDGLRNAQVLVLGGGNPQLGMWRFREIGARYFGDPGLFAKIMHERQGRGMTTVGFSAGADQLAEYMWGAIDSNPSDPHGIGLCRNILASLHYEYGGGDYIRHTAGRLPHCLSFGLPNDSGIGVDQGFLGSGNIWQLIWFVTDKSWDVPQDEWHIKTRAGEKIQHFYADGRHWGFDGGDMMVRVMAPDDSWQNAWIVRRGGHILDYYSQRSSGYSSVDQILASH